MFAYGRMSLTIYIYARVRAHTYLTYTYSYATRRPRRLIVSVVACNPRGHRKHVINTCSLSARARERGRAAVAAPTLSWAERETITDYCRPDSV